MRSFRGRTGWYADGQSLISVLPLIDRITATSDPCGNRAMGLPMCCCSATKAFCSICSVVPDIGTQKRAPRASLACRAGWPLGRGQSWANSTRSRRFRACSMAQSRTSRFGGRPYSSSRWCFDSSLGRSPRVCRRRSAVRFVSTSPRALRCAKASSVFQTCSLSKPKDSGVMSVARCAIFRFPMWGLHWSLSYAIFLFVKTICDKLVLLYMFELMWWMSSAQPLSI